MQTPLFSVIVPVYKTEAFLRQCMDSILGQTFSDFQVVLVDDGSPDGCPEICDEYARLDSRVTVVHKCNGGLVSARKAGLLQCRGKYIVNVDSDDYIAPDHLARFAEVIGENTPDVILFGATRFLGEDQSYMRTQMRAGFYAGEKMEEIRRNILCSETGETTILFGICLAAVKRELYADFQMAAPENISRGEDLIVTVPLLAACDSVFVLDCCGYFYRDNPASISNTFRHGEVQEMKELVAYLRGVLDETYNEKIDRYVATHYFDFLDRAMLIMSYGEYRALVRQTLDEELYGHLRRATCKGSPMWQIVFALMRRKRFDALWVLRKIRKRKG